MASLGRISALLAASGPQACWTASPAAAASLAVVNRAYSAIGGKANPLDVTRETTPMLHQEDTANSGAEASAFEVKVPGVAAFSEPNVPKPGTVQPPNPSPELLEPVPIAKVTHDGDVIEGSVPDAPASGQPRN